MLSPEAELEKAFERGEMVIVCWEPECTMHRLPHWEEGKWITHEKVKDYSNYSYGICVWHYRICQRLVEEYATEASVAIG